jgi:hypothetical protein
MSGAGKRPGDAPPDGPLSTKTIGSQRYRQDVTQ